MKPTESPHEGQGQRIAAAAIGCFLVGIAATIALAAQPLTTGALLAALVLGGLGAEALVSAARGRRCLVSRIGPLP